MAGTSPAMTNERSSSAETVLARPSTCRASPPALLPLILILVVRRAGAAAPGAEETAVLLGIARDANLRALAHREAALRLVVQRHDELRAIVGLAVRRLVRDDNRGSRHCGRRNAIEHLLRDADAAERGLGIVPAVDRDRGPAQTAVVTRHRCEHMR